MRYLHRVDDDQPFAYADHRDFYLVSDDSLWAHESHSVLLAATSGTTLLRRIGSTYYDVGTGLPVYSERRGDPSTTTKTKTKAPVSEPAAT
jgi:hypothetical protein